MKKLFCIFLSIFLLLALCACAVEPAPTTEPPTESQPASPDGLVAVVLDPWREDTPGASGEETAFSFSGQHITVIAPSRDAADSISAKLQNFMQEHYETASQAREAAVQETLLAPYTYTVQFDPARADDHVISFTGRLVTYLGGAHPTATNLCGTFDTSTGKLLTLPEVLKPGTFSQFAALVTERFSALADQGVTLNSDFADTVFESLYGTDENWYFSWDAMVFTFAPYAIAPYSQGFLSVEIPYEELTDFLREEFMPASVNGAGECQPSFEPEAQVPAGALHAIVHSDAKAFAMRTDTALPQVSLVYHTWVAEDIWEDSTVFTANRLTPEDVLYISAFIPDVMPNLTLTYRTADGSFAARDIFQSGMDGSIFLQ